jgi:hypothetical protein
MPPRCARAALLLLLLLAGLPHPALAHDVPPGTVLLDIGRRAIEVELQLPLSELGAALQLPLAASPETVVPQYGPRIGQYLRDHFALRGADGRVFALQPGAMRLLHTGNPQWTSNDWLVLQARLLAPPGDSTEVFTLEDSLIVERVVSHNTLVYVRRDLRNGLLGDKPVPVGLLGFGKTRLAVDGSGGSWWQGFRQLFALGLRHIAEGPDHLLFLLALLLPAPLLAQGRHWQGCRSSGRSLRGIAGVVSGFTLGHSLTLALAAAAWVAPPVRAVEVLIAVSILVSAVHAWRPLFAGRELWIAGGFGLVHGLAFAEVLSGLDFDGSTLLLSLLGFNLGIEAMQLLVIGAALPLILLLSRTRYYAVLRPACAAFAAACALGWIGERAFGLANPLQAVVEFLAPPPAWFAAALAVAGTLCWCALLAGARSRAPALARISSSA